MKPSLRVGDKFCHEFTIGENKTVPALYPESAQFQKMPHVFATGYFVGLLEWACIELLAPHYEEGEGSLGTHIDISHVAPTPPGHTVVVDATLTQIDGRSFWFDVEANDNDGLIGKGRHQRAAVFWDKFKDRVAKKSHNLTAKLAAQTPLTSL